MILVILLIFPDTEDADFFLIFAMDDATSWEAIISLTFQALLP